jgi:tetratricopeptide (TPR) repeat protein
MPNLILIKLEPPRRISALSHSLLFSAVLVCLVSFSTPAFSADFTPFQIQNFVARARALGSGSSSNSQEAAQLTSAASLMYKQGNVRESREILSIICNSKYVDCVSLCSLADHYIDQVGETDKVHSGEKLLQRAAKLDPNCGRAWTTLADLAFKDSNLSLALKYSDKSLSVMPKSRMNRLSYMVRASILAQMKRYDEALECVRKAERPAGYRAELWRIKASILENLNRYAEAAAAYRTALSKSKQNKDWMVFQIVRCLEKQNLNKEAIGELGQLIKTNPSDAEAYRIRSAIKTKINDLNGAIADLSKVLELEPTTKSFTERAKLYKRLGKNDLARKDERAAEKLKASPF